MILCGTMKIKYVEIICINDQNLKQISKIYEYEMKNNKLLRNDNRIILVIIQIMLYS